MPDRFRERPIWWGSLGLFDCQRQTNSIAPICGCCEIEAVPLFLACAVCPNKTPGMFLQPDGIGLFVSGRGKQSDNATIKCK